MAASRALTSGQIRRLTIVRRASIAIGKAPRIPRTLPSRESSPTNSASGTSFLFRPPYAPRMPSAMARSKPEASLRMSAGARLMVDLGGRNVVAAIFQCRADPVAAFADGSIGQADSVKVVFCHFDAGDIHFHFDDVGVNAVNGSTQSFIEHRAPVGTRRGQRGWEILG